MLSTGPVFKQLEQVIQYSKTKIGKRIRYLSSEYCDNREGDGVYNVMVRLRDLVAPL